MLGGLLILMFYSRRQEAIFILAGMFILIRLVNALFQKYDPEACAKLEKIRSYSFRANSSNSNSSSYGYKYI